MHTKKHVLYASYFCGACLYAGVWFSPVPIAFKVVLTGVLTLLGAMMLNVITEMGQ